MGTAGPLLIGSISAVVSSRLIGHDGPQREVPERERIALDIGAEQAVGVSTGQGEPDVSGADGFGLPRAASNGGKHGRAADGPWCPMGALPEAGKTGWMVD